MEELPVGSPTTSKANKVKRMDFANEHITKPTSFWNKVIFSDKSKFCIFGIKGKKMIWRKRGAAFEKENFGCMAAGGVGNLTFIESTMDHKDYMVILEQNLKQRAEKLQIADDFYTQLIT